MVVCKIHYSLENFRGASGHGLHVLYTASNSRGGILQSRESLRYATANVEEDAHLDVSARGFWVGHHQRTFFNVRVFNPIASSNRITYQAGNV